LEKIKVFWGEERCVPPNHKERNFNMTKKNLLDNIPIPEENVYGILGENSPESEAGRYSGLIKHNTASFNSLPKFDIMLLRLGLDRYTASVLYGNQALFPSTNICQSSINAQTQQQRITLTGSVINNAATIIFLDTGTSKAGTTAALLKNKAKSFFAESFVKPACRKLVWLPHKATKAVIA